MEGGGMKKIFTLAVGFLGLWSVGYAGMSINPRSPAPGIPYQGNKLTVIATFNLPNNLVWGQLSEVNASLKIMGVNGELLEDIPLKLEKPSSTTSRHLYQIVQCNHKNKKIKIVLFVSASNGVKKEGLVRFQSERWLNMEGDYLLSFGEVTGLQMK